VRRFRLLRGAVALALAVLLALPSIAHVLPASAWAAAPAVVAARHLPDDGEPTLAKRGDRTGLAILPRLPHLDGGWLHPPPKAAAPRLQVVRGPPPPATAWPDAAARSGLHRSSVGTARKPTGPPS
jgi:hypothetical protein